MSNWPASKAKRVLAALLRIGWRVARQRGSHRLLSRPGWPITNLRSMTKTKSEAGCWRESLRVLGSNLKIFRLPAPKRDSRLLPINALASVQFLGCRQPGSNPYDREVADSRAEMPNRPKPSQTVIRELSGRHPKAYALPLFRSPGDLGFEAVQPRARVIERLGFQTALARQGI